MTHERKPFWLFSLTLFLYVQVDELVKETKGSTEKATSYKENPSKASGVKSNNYKISKIVFSQAGFQGNFS